MLDTTIETPISVFDAAQITGNHPSTVVRWITTGVPGPDGVRVRLDGLRLGQKWRTSREALQRFGEAITPRLDRDREQSRQAAGARNAK